MTLTTTLDRQEFPGDGANKNFPFNFKFFDNSQIYVYLIDTAGAVVVKTINVDYTLSGAMSPFGGTVSMSVAPPLNYRVLVRRILPLSQPTSIRNQGAFFPAIHEDVFDRLTMQIQQASAIANDSLQLDLPGLYWDALGKRITRVADPVSAQDAATKNSVEQYVGSILSTGQGPVNNASNVLYVAPDGTPKTVQNMSGPGGAYLIGDTDWRGLPVTVGAQLDVINQGTVYADDPVYGGNIVTAAAAVGDNTVFVIRQPYTLTAPLRFVGRAGVVVVCTGAGKLNGSRTNFTFPTANARGSCILIIVLTRSRTELTFLERGLQSHPLAPMFLPMVTRELSSISAHPL